MGKDLEKPPRMFSSANLVNEGLRNLDPISILSKMFKKQRDDQQVSTRRRGFWHQKS